MRPAELVELRKKLYSQLRLSESIDLAWSMYIDSHLIKAKREVALQFLIYAFDLKSMRDLNKQLLTLMHDREMRKGTNDEYIPGLSPKFLKLDPSELSPKKILSHELPDPKLGKLLIDKEMLDVNKDDKRDDVRIHIKSFFSVERAKYRVHIHRGKFHQNGELFSTTGSVTHGKGIMYQKDDHFTKRAYVAHGKTNYAAFTLNANGELSVFNHYGLADQVAHSTMNAGSPVVGAGELIIENGELVAINTYSGHYEPSLFNIYRTLEYFSDKGVNITKTKVYLFEQPRSRGLLFDASLVVINASTSMYKLPAHHLLKEVKNELQLALAHIESDTVKYQTSVLKNGIYALKDFIIGSTLTKSRKLIALEVAKIAKEFVDVLNGGGDDKVAHLTVLNGLTSKLDELRDKNNKLSVKHGKKSETGRLHENLESFLQQTIALRHLKAIDSEPTEQQNYKSLC